MSSNKNYQSAANMPKKKGNTKRSKKTSDEPLTSLICPQLTLNASKQYEDDDWVVAQFPLVDMGGYKKYIAKILQVQQSGAEKRFLVDCMRPKESREHNGFIYKFPNIRDDETYCKESNILYKLNPPELWQRYLKFEKHCDTS